MRLRTLLAGKPNRIIDALDSCGIKTDADLLSSASALPELWQYLPSDSITFTELEEIRELAIDSLASDGMTGDSLADECEADSLLKWTTACPELSSVLSAVQTGIIEVAGDKESGKTVASSFFLALEVLCH